MKYSENAIRVLAAQCCGLIKSRAQFAKLLPNVSALERMWQENPALQDTCEQLREQFETQEAMASGDDDQNWGFLCAFDPEFPLINPKSSNGERPYLLFYRGDPELLQDLNQVVAVIGVLNPAEEVIRREQKVVEALVREGLVILSGLAKGCDSVAHQTCLEHGGRTIAVLPSTLWKVYPAQNRELAEEIVRRGGLLITEYFREPASRFESTGRFPDRDRLQAMFSKGVILSASYRKNEGDSGSRYAMEYAKKIHVNRYMIYDEQTDRDDPQFGLNQDYARCERDVRVLKQSTIEELKQLKNPLLMLTETEEKYEQLRLW